VTEINVREILLLGGKGGGGGGDMGDAPSGPRGKGGDKGGDKAKGGDFEEFPNALEAEDDDLPF
jgi:hypothetical protein